MTRKPDDWMPLKIGRYLANTSHLTRDQHGGYLLLLMAYWTRGGPLPADDARLGATAKATPIEWRKLRPILAEFFVEDGGHWHQKRADEELSTARKFVEAKSEAGKKGAKTKWQKNSKTDGKGDDKNMAQPSVCHAESDAPIPLPSEVPSPIPSELRLLPAAAGASVSKKSGYSESFEAFWTAYPTDKNMPKKSAFEQWQRLSEKDRIAATKAIPGFKRYCAENASWYRPIYADRFLSKRKYEGYEELPGEQKPLHASWNGSAKPLIAEIGEKNFSAWFGQFPIDKGPPAQLTVSTLFQKSWIEQHYATAVRKVFGNLEIVVQREAA